MSWSHSGKIVSIKHNQSGPPSVQVQATHDPRMVTWAEWVQSSYKAPAIGTYVTITESGGVKYAFYPRPFGVIYGPVHSNPTSTPTHTD